MTVLTMKEATKKTKLIKDAGKKLDTRIHQVAVSGLVHFMLSGDNSILTNLVKVMPKSARGNALKFWISKHTNNKLKWDKNAHGKTGGYKGKKPELSSWEQLAIALTADNSPFYEKKDTSPSVFNGHARILNLVKTLDKHAAELTEEDKHILSVLKKELAA